MSHGNGAMGIKDVRKSRESRGTRDDVFIELNK